ncbi:hypothetical protein HII31_05922 [Pseudocercospora fuligena]|uniref:Uncharacterized protein n=1 Tax=Pseudocercospora fuligena TaxID=685502 RepID=A0A8H6RMC5_9PEZI|nr:hypothetical protein HII31_05922 [Pseudocercospora fuligena]
MIAGRDEVKLRAASHLSDCSRQVVDLLTSFPYRHRHFQVFRQLEKFDLETSIYTSRSNQVKKEQRVTMSSNWSRRLRDEQLGRDLDPYLEAAGYGGQSQANSRYSSSSIRHLEEPEAPFNIEDMLRDSDDDENAVTGEAVTEDEDETEHAEQTQVNGALLSQEISQRGLTKAGGYGTTQDPLRKDSLHPSYQSVATTSTFYQPQPSSGEPDQDQNMRQRRATRRKQAVPPVASAQADTASGNQPDAEDTTEVDPLAAPSEDDESGEVSYWDSLGLPPLAAGAKHPNRIPDEIPNDDFELVYRKKKKWIKEILRAINTSQTSKGFSAKRKKLNRFCRKQIAELLPKAADLYERVDTMVMNVIFIHREGFFPDTEINGRPAADLDVEGDMTCTERMEKLVAAIASEAVLAL